MRESSVNAGPQEGASAPSLFSKWKVTFAAVCLFLGWLGWEDLRVAWRNPEPQRLIPICVQSFRGHHGDTEITEETTEKRTPRNAIHESDVSVISSVCSPWAPCLRGGSNRTHLRISPASPGPVRDWLALEGCLDLAEAINTSGTLQIEALLVPVVESPGDGRPIRFLLETRDPERLDLFRHLHLGQESEEAKAAFRQAQAARLAPRVSVTGLRMEGFAARANASRLKKLALESGLVLAPDATLLVEGRTPSPKRGLFFLTMALAGLFIPNVSVGTAKGAKALRAREKN